MKSNLDFVIRKNNKKMFKAFKKYKLFFLSFFTITNIYYFQIYSIRDKILLSGKKFLNRCLKQKLNRKFKKLVSILSYK
jgi:hypothetical protein